MSENNWEKNEQRRFSRVGCRLTSEFQLTEGGAWLSAEVLDFSVAGIRVCFEREQRGVILNEADIEWQEACFCFKDAEDIVVKGHFLMVYENREGFFTSGFEFLEVDPARQIKLLRLYATHCVGLAESG